MSQILFQLPNFASFFFLGALISYWLALAFPKTKKLVQVGQLCTWSSFFCLTTSLTLRWIQSHYFPLSNLYESLLFLSWAITAIHLVLEWKTSSRIIGVLTTPLLVFLSGFSNFTLPVEMQISLPLVPSLQSNWLMMHVSMMMSSYALLIVGSLLSIFYLCLSRSIFSSFHIPFSSISFVKTYSNLFFKTSINKDLYKSGNQSFQNLLDLNLTLTKNGNQISSQTNKEEIQISEINSLIEKNENVSFDILLNRIDLWSYRILGLGFPFLTIGIISGAVWANEAWGSYWSWDPKETWAFVTWLVFASYFHARFIQGWEKEQASFLASIGFFVIWICYLGVNFFAQGLHSYGFLQIT
jgi:cytochrome c-type biogenesis protein CcsB